MKDYDFDPNTDLDDLLIADADLDDFQPLLQGAQELTFPGTNTSTEHNEDDALTSNDVGELLADVSSILSDSTWNKDVSNTNEFSNTFEQLVSELNAIESNENENFEYSNEPLALVTGHTPVKDNNDTSPTVSEDPPTPSNLVEDSSPEPKKPRLSETAIHSTVSLPLHQQANGFFSPVKEYLILHSPWALSSQSSPATYSNTSSLSCSSNTTDDHTEQQMNFDPRQKNARKNERARERRKRKKEKEIEVLRNAKDLEETNARLKNKLQELKDDFCDIAMKYPELFTTRLCVLGIFSNQHGVLDSVYRPIMDNLAEKDPNLHLILGSGLQNFLQWCTRE